MKDTKPVLEVKNDGQIYIDGILVSNQDVALDLLWRNDERIHNPVPFLYWKENMLKPGIYRIPDLKWEVKENYYGGIANWYKVAIISRPSEIIQGAPSQMKDPLSAEEILLEKERDIAFRSSVDGEIVLYTHTTGDEIIKAMHEYASQFKSKDYIPEPGSFSIEDMRAAFYAGKDHTADEYRDGQSIGFDEWISTRKPS